MTETDRDRLMRRAGILNVVPRDAARRLLADGASVEDLLALVDEIHRRHDAWAAVYADRDVQVRAASKRALDCNEHGPLITALEKQVGEFDRRFYTTDHARVILVGGLHDIENYLKKAETPDIGAVLARLGSIWRAHQAAWQPTAKPKQAKPAQPKQPATETPPAQPERHEDLLDLIGTA